MLEVRGEPKSKESPRPNDPVDLLNRVARREFVTSIEV